MSVRKAKTLGEIASDLWLLARDVEAQKLGRPTSQAVVLQHASSMLGAAYQLVHDVDEGVVQ